MEINLIKAFKQFFDGTPPLKEKGNMIVDVSRMRNGKYYSAKAEYNDTLINNTTNRMGYTMIYPTVFDGEKNIGALGDAQRLILDFQVLSTRSWELYLKSDIAHTIISRKVKWVASDGLKLKVEPDANLFANLKIKIDIEKHNAIIESIWNNYIQTPICDYTGKKNLNELEEIQYKNRVVGGDVLCIIRLVKGVPKVQLIDGTHVMTPLSFGLVKTDPKVVDNVVGFDRINPDNGNRVRWGVEINSQGQSIAFFVRTGITSNEFVRIEKYNKTFGLLQADLLTGLEYRLDNNRGIPEISPNMENVGQLDKYKSAFVTREVERAKLVFSIEHELGASEEDPYVKNQAKKIGHYSQNDILQPSNDLAYTVEGKAIANDFAARRQQEIVNLPAGSKLTMNEGKSQAHFKDFYDPNVLTICATFGIPVEVALMKYEGSFSSSRAGLKDWEHTLKVDRKKCSSFKQMVFNYWLDIQVLQMNIDLPEYLDALYQGNWQVLAAYRNCEWVGSNVPHIDPEKEARTERIKLGGLFANVPLCTVESSTLSLSEGNSVANLSQAGRELKESVSAGFTIPISEQVQVKITE